MNSQQQLSVQEQIQILGQQARAASRVIAAADTRTKNQALLATEGVTLEFTPAAIRRLAEVAYQVNESTENIGARRLSTVMERLLDDLSFDAPNRGGQTVVLDAADVDARLATLAGDVDLSRYIL